MTHKLFGKQKMGRIQASVGAGKSEAGIAAKQFVQEGGTASPEAQQKEWRGGVGGFYFFREASLLDPSQQRMTYAANPIGKARSPRDGGTVGLKPATQVAPRLQR
ncbi:MAG: hypothetical protein ABSF59_22400 [Candidatus Sulfotelmatobacter sp.]